MSRRMWLLALVAGTLSVFSLVQAQDNSGGNTQNDGGGQRGRGRNGGGRGARGGGDPAQYRERMMSSVKDDLGATDDEWKTLQPKVEKVMSLQREVRPPMGGRFAPQPAADQPQSDVAKARHDLETAVKDKGAAADDLAKKLTAYREARDKATTQLQAAQKDLKGSVNARQEAALVLRGMLD